MPVDGSRHDPRRRGARGLTRTVGGLLRSLLQRLAAWQKARRPGSHPAEVVIGTLRRLRLAIAIRVTVVQGETTPPPVSVFLERMVTHPLSPYCPRCSLPLEPWQADPRAAGTATGYECRPCGTHLRWPPADVLQQMQREVRRHYAHYWAQYREALRPHEHEAPRGPPR